MRRLGFGLVALGCWWLAGVHAQEADEEQPGPDLDFLEYLGTWAEEDDEWLAIEEWERDNGGELDEKDPDGSLRQKDGDDESD